MKQPFERLLLGHTLAGRYRLDEVVGAGGMSVVFRGHDLTLGRPVAVKVVSIPADSEGMRENLRERFRREAASAASIPHHPNVVQVYDYGTDPSLDLDFIVMELLRGHDLKDHLARGAPPFGEAMRIVRDAARGVAAGHRAGIIHRDVKPANVFLVGDGQMEFVRVLDFGIAKPLRADGEDALTTIGQLPHSPAYASPEQINPDIPVTTASDVYQLGLVAFETLTGERPFTQAQREHIRSGEEVPIQATDRWRAVPEGVREVIERALHT
ncbi:MAG: serine/threonine protein kinase, partial [Gemmatimonadetes bacterium]|nr:serine/threonine protein kinase [Gemmatimonadota bacterium]